MKLIQLHLQLNQSNLYHIEKLQSAVFCFFEFAIEWHYLCLQCRTM
jgi:hypothetical protein